MNVDYDELIRNGVYTTKTSGCGNLSYLEYKLRIPILNKEGDVSISNLEDLNDASQINYVCDMINSIIAMNNELKESIKYEIFKLYEVVISDTWYGLDYESEKSTKQINAEHFKVYNKDDALEKSEIACIWFNLEHTKNRTYYIQFIFDWEEEHGIQFGISEGKIVDIC